MRDDAASLLERGLAELDLTLSGGQFDAFLTYLAELKKWNRAYNLTALRSDRDIVVRHFLDSLLFVKVLPSHTGSLADIGSGAGLPGIPISIVRPDLKVLLVEPTEKKIAFLDHLRRRLCLSHTEVMRARVQEIRDRRFDALVTRALFSIREFIACGSRLLNPGGLLVLSKGPKLAEEVEGLEGLQIFVTQLRLPVEHVIRRLVTVHCGESADTGGLSGR